MGRMKIIVIIALAMISTCTLAQRNPVVPRDNVPIDSIRLSDPFVLADSATMTYYMTGTGGMMWKSKDLKLWSGPYRVAETDPSSWMGPRPMIWAAELHQYQGKYYYFATFTNQEVFIDTVAGRPIERRASHILVSDKAAGPYIASLPVWLPWSDASRACGRCKLLRQRRGTGEGRRECACRRLS